jgi:hypothetical protein
LLKQHFEPFTGDCITKSPYKNLHGADFYTDAQHGIDAFLNKKTPIWSDR